MDCAVTRGKRRAPTHRGRLPVGTRPTGFREERDVARERLGLVSMPDEGRAWVGALILLLFALTLRLWNLGGVQELIFDETYYVKDGYTVAVEGVERAWPQDPDTAFEAGATDTYLSEGAYVVHPPAGKWIIGLPMAIWGADNPWMWRLSVALLGSVSVLMVARIGRRLFRSTSVGLIAGLLIAVDGQHLVASRTSLLDLPLMFFVLGAFGALLIDRDQHRERLADAHSRGEASPEAPARAGIRWWRLGAGVLLGLACSVKWSGLFFMAVFGIMTVLWDWWARRRIGERRWLSDGFTRDAVPAFFATVGTGLLTYVASWAGWFASSEGYFRGWAAEQGFTAGGPLGQALYSLWHYHRHIFSFHISLDAEHAYASHPVTWLLQLRPVNYSYDSLSYGQSGCKVDQCAAQILALGHPLVWWGGTAAILVLILRVVLRRDWRALATLSGIIAGYLPWFFTADRTIFAFYTVVFVPWLTLGLAYALGLMARLPSLEHQAEPQFQPLLPGSAPARTLGIGLAGTFLVAVLLVAAFFWPVWAGEVLEFRQWQWRLWIESWR